VVRRELHARGAAGRLGAGAVPIPELTRILGIYSDIRTSYRARPFAEKRGVIKVFDSLTDTSPDIFADLNVNVYNFWDRGLLGMALDPNFPAVPYVYVLYTYDHVLGSSAPAPRWGTPASTRTPAPPRPARRTTAVS
jgi:hypothetical protein